jgi:hypothetical protein
MAVPGTCRAAPATSRPPAAPQNLAVQRSDYVAAVGPWWQCSLRQGEGRGQWPSSAAARPPPGQHVTVRVQQVTGALAPRLLPQAVE